MRMKSVKCSVCGRFMSDKKLHKNAEVNLYNKQGKLLSSVKCHTLGRGIEKAAKLAGFTRKDTDGIIDIKANIIVTL